MQNHHASATRGVWLEVVGVFVFVGLVYLLDRMVGGHLEGTALAAMGVALAIIPAAIWLIAFYRQDTFEPEPMAYVVGVFLLGALLAQAVGQPLVRTLFHADTWVGAHPAVELLCSILIVGLVQEFLKYAAVRYTVYNAAEFDQRVDGIIYGASAGLGYATVVNLQYVLMHGGVDLSVGAINVAVAALAQASFGGMMGYFLGRARFDAMGWYWLPIGLLSAATLNGLVTYALRQAVMLGGFSFNPWYGLIGAAIVAGVTFAVLFRAIARMRHEPGQALPA